MPVHERETREENDTEITLSPASLLGIFLGLVLVCGVFFGFGYSVGRRTPAFGGSAAAADDADAPITAESKPPAGRMDGRETPEQDAQNQEMEDPGAGISGALRAEAGEGAHIPSAQAAETAAVAPAAKRLDKPSALRADLPSSSFSASSGRAGTPSALGSSSAAIPGAEPGRFVVQVAAVTTQEDADVLVSALRQRGYQVMERSDPKDKFLHVQIGPFANREDANAMREKLLADGYNAFIKQ